MYYSRERESTKKRDSPFKSVFKLEPVMVRRPSWEVSGDMDAIKGDESAFKYVKLN